MNIKTKYNHGQTLVTIYNGQIHQAPVTEIRTYTNNQGKTRITYTLGGPSQSPATYDREESEVFSNLEDLQKSGKVVTR
jgi:hypothetical protein